MAEGGSGSVDISLSMGIVRKRVQGNCFVTIGGASIIKYPSSQKESPPDPSQNAASVEQKNYKTVVVTTSEVVSKADLTSSTPWRVEFLPDKWYKRNTEKFSLVGVEFMEMHLSNEASSLTLFPTESLHKETWFPQFISGNDWASNRSQSCYQAQRKTKVKDTKIELICYVLVVDDTTGKFHVACYALSADERGSYYLHPHGNKAKLKKLDDFQPTEKPKGSVILNEDGYVVGFLAFSDTDEIHPLFLPDYLQDNDVPRQVLSTEATHNPEDHNQNKTDENHILQVTIINKQIVGSQNEPVFNTSHNRDLPQRSLSEQLTPRPRRRLLNSQSVLEPIPLNEDAPYPKTVSDTTIPKHNPTFPERHSNSYRRMDTVEVSTEKKHLSSEVSDAVLNNIYVMDHLKNRLDTSLRGLQNWRYLAGVNKVSIDKQQRWQLGEYYSKSEKMFETLKAKSPKLSMTSLVTHLQALEINGVKKYIEDHQLQKVSVEEFFDSPYRNHTGKVLLMLDLIDIEKWCSLGIGLGINKESLTQIMTDCVNRQENPGGDVLNIISTSNATMTIGQFKKKLEKIERSDIAGKLEKLSEKSMIGELLEDLDLAREVTTMLNNPGIKNYKDLASACGISRETYQSLQPPCADSPTQKTIEEIVQRKPKYTVEDLFKDLKDIKRTDVIEVISPYFEEKDVLAWKRKWGITDE